MNIKEHFLGQSPLAILLQNETDDSLWFFINWVSSLSFCPTRGSRSFLKLQLTLLIVLSFPSIQRSYAQYNILTGQNSSALETERTNTQQRLQQQNLQIMMQNGYQPPAIPPSDPTLSHQFIVNQYNQNTQDSKQARQIKELQEILIEMKKNEVRNTSASSAVNNNSAQLQKYNKAFSAIKNMLDGKTPLSLKEAYFQVEQAYGNEYLSYNEYNTSIKQSVDFIKKWLLQNNYSLSDNNALNIGIQRFMSDTLSITITVPDSKEGSKKVTHIPFFYDYNDYQGEHDFRNYFSTKTFATGSGQCSSLPAVYLILAEGIGAKAYLTFAPMHSFIKYPDSKGHIKNYEPTSNWSISDEWYQDNMFVNDRAKQTGIYLDTLNKREVVAHSLISLASGYMRLFGITNDSLLRNCANLSMKNFPKGNNIDYYFLLSSFCKHQLMVTMQQEGITDISNVRQSPKALAIYQRYLQIEETIKQLGYEDTPEQAYNELLKQHEFKGKRQAAQNISGKEKRKQFYESK